MKRTIAFILALTMLLSASACGAPANDEQSDETKIAGTAETPAAEVTDQETEAPEETETNKRDIKPMWGAHSGFGICTGCRQEIWKIVVADLEKEGVNYVDGYAWYQALNANESVRLYKQRSTGKLLLVYKGAYSSIEIDLTDTNCQHTYVLDNSVFPGRLNAQEIPQDENARDRAQKYAMAAASAAEKYFLQGKKYSMKNFGFIFV